MPTEASERELRSSFDRLSRATVTPDGAPGNLLRFYAVECGLKAALMRHRRLRSTAQLDQDLRSHDLARLAKELHIAPRNYDGARPCRRAHGTAVPPSTVAAHAVHEAWRYGVRLNDQDEESFVAGLAVLIRWCREELRL